MIALNYTAMLNGYSQWLNMKEKKILYRDISEVLISVMLHFNHKKKIPLRNIKYYCLYVVCTFED